MLRHTPSFKAIVVNGVRPLVLSKKLLIQVLGSVKLVQRMLYATRHHLAPNPWLRIVRWGQPGCELLVDTSSVESAYARLLAGEEPPRLPSEPQRAERNPEPHFVNRVLIVEYHSESRAAVVLLLRLQGIDCVAVGCVGDAMRFLKWLPHFGAVVCDHDLPDGFGVEVYREVRARDALIPFVSMSGRHELEVPPDDPHFVFLPKPFGIEDLLAAVAKAGRVSAMT